jgi:hypothetical protein
LLRPARHNEGASEQTASLHGCRITYQNTIPLTSSTAAGQVRPPNQERRPLEETASSLFSGAPKENTFLPVKLIRFPVIKILAVSLYICKSTYTLRINIAYVGRAPPSVTNPRLRWAEPGHWIGKRNARTHVWPQGDPPSTVSCGPSWYCHILAQCHSATFEKAGPCLLQESNQPKPRNPCFAKCTASTLMPVMCQFLVNFCFILFYYK